MTWIVAETQPQRESFAKKNIDRFGYETYLPRIRERRNRQTRIAPLFPRYLFVKITESWYAIASAMGVTRVISHGERPSRLDAKVINELRSRERGGFVQLPRAAKLKPGQHARVLRGPFKGVVAPMHAGMSDRERGRVLLDYLGRRINVDRADVEFL